MFKHISTHHREMKIADGKFGMRVVRTTQSALERQIYESVRIQEEKKKHFLMNSRSEYNRCTIPRLVAQMGDRDYEIEKQKEKRIDKENEELIRKEIARRKRKNANREERRSMTTRMK